MPIILIEKDPATRVPREVRNLDEAQVLADQGFAVHVQQEDGSTLPLADVLAAAERADEKHAKGELTDPQA